MPLLFVNIMHSDLNNKGEFELFYKSVFPVLYRISTRIVNNPETAEDICQEAFIKFRNKAPVTNDVNQARYWMIRVVKNICFNYLKRKSRERQAYEKISRQPVKTADTGENALIREESRGIVRDALLKLPRRLRNPLVLKEYGELSYREISEMLGISEANVKIRIFRARKRLSEIIDQEDLHVS